LIENYDLFFVVVVFVMQLRQEEVAVVTLNKKITFTQSIFTPAASDDGRAFARNAVGVFQIVEGKFRGVRKSLFSSRVPTSEP